LIESNILILIAIASIFVAVLILKSVSKLIVMFVIFSLSVIVFNHYQGAERNIASKVSQKNIIEDVKLKTLEKDSSQSLKAAALNVVDVLNKKLANFIDKNKGE